MFSSWTVSTVNTVKNIVKGDGDGDTPEDTFICRTLRDYFVAKSKKTNYPHWPEWMPGPRPVGLPAPAQISTIGSSYGVDRNVGQRYGSGQDAGNNSYAQQDTVEMNGSGGQAASARTANAVSALLNKPRATANAAARVGIAGSAGRNNAIDRMRQKSNQPKPEPRPIPSQRDYSQQARSQNQQSYSSNELHDPYNYNDPRTGTAGYESNGRPANGYRGATQQPPMSSNAPWSSGASNGRNGGYSEPNGYEQPPSRSTPNPSRNGRGLPGGLPTNPRNNR